MNYSIEYTEQASVDLDEIYRYIAFTLLSPKAAENTYREILKSIHSLDTFPLRNVLVSEEPWSNLGLRKMLVKNYIVFYTVDESTMTARIIRIMYGGRDVNKQLLQSDM